MVRRVYQPSRAGAKGLTERRVLLRPTLRTSMITFVSRFGLDFAAVAEIHDRILAARNAGAAVLLVSEDLDEILALSDRVVVMSGGRFVHETSIGAADIAVIGPAMAGHHHATRG